MDQSKKAYCGQLFRACWLSSAQSSTIYSGIHVHMYAHHETRSLIQSLVLMRPAIIQIEGCYSFATNFQAFPFYMHYVCVTLGASLPPHHYNAHVHVNGKAWNQGYVRPSIYIVHCFLSGSMCIEASCRYIRPTCIYVIMSMCRNLLIYWLYFCGLFPSYF